MYGIDCQLAARDKDVEEKLKSILEKQFHC